MAHPLNHNLQETFNEKLQRNEDLTAEEIKLKWSGFSLMLLNNDIIGKVQIRTNENATILVLETVAL